MSTAETYESAVCRTLDPRELNRDRQAALSPYLDRLGVGPNAAEPGGEVPIVLSVGQASLELADWERQALRQFYGRVDAQGRPWPVFVAEGIAFRAKCLERCATLEAREAPPGTQPEEELITEVGVGIALLQELQWSIDSLIHEGDLAIARKLTEFRNSVSQSLATLRSRMGSEAYSRGSDRSRELVGPVPVMAPRRQEEELPWRAPAHFHGEPAPKRPVRKRRRRRVSRLRPLLLMLALSLLAWVGARSLLVDYQPPPKLTAEQFGHLQVVREVSGRAPGLELVLDAAGWEGMTPEQRLETVDEIGRIVSLTHYHSVNLRTDEGATVAEWRRDRGSQLFGSPAESS
jgi:hypothetical protein